MNKCKYQTIEYSYWHGCLSCGEEWYFSTPYNDPMCEQCIAHADELEVYAQQVAMLEMHKEATRKMNEALKRYYYTPIQAQLNEHSPIITHFDTSIKGFYGTKDKAYKERVKTYGSTRSQRRFFGRVLGRGS